MTRAGVRRLVVISAAPVGVVPSSHRPRPPRYDPIDRNVRHGLIISRPDVAHLMLTVLGQRKTVGHAIGVAY